MADETQVKTTSTPDSAAQSAAASAPADSTSSSPKGASKTNKTLIAMIILGLLIVGAGSFFAGRAAAPVEEQTPTPTVSQEEQVAPSLEPTLEEASPTVQTTQAPSPTSGQQTTPTSGQVQASPTLTP